MAKNTGYGIVYPSLKDMKLEKEFIDELRIRNGNLEVSLFDDSYTEGAL